MGTGNGIILLVEDNASDEALALLALRRNNISNEVIVARDGVEALDYLFGRGKHAGRDTRIMPAIILLDLKLPRLDGLQVLEQMRADERTRLIPVAVLTTSNEPQDIVASYSLGANSFVRKPVNFDDFADAIKHLGAFWTVINTGPHEACMAE